MEFDKYKNRFFNFFYGFIQKRQLGFWKKMPHSQMRLYMCLLRNGNKMSRHELTDKLIEIQFSQNRQAAKQAIRRGLNSHILVENGSHLSVAEPISFVIRFGSVFDGWKIFVVPAAIVTVVVSFIAPQATSLFAVLTLGLIIFGYIIDYINTFKY